MAVNIPQVITPDSASGAEIIDGCLKFDLAKKNSLQRSFASGNRRTWTWAGWVKRGASKLEQVIFNCSTASNNYCQIYFHANTDEIVWINATASPSAGQAYFITEKKFRDYSSWYHIVCAVDTTQDQLSGRVFLWVNGKHITEYNSYTMNNLAENVQTSVNENLVHSISGKNPLSDVHHLDGYQSQCYFIDGKALGASYFGYNDPLTGTWRPKKFRAEGTTYNDGTVWSSGSTVTGGSISNAADGFDGSTASSGAHCTLQGTNTSTTANVTFAAPLKNVLKVEVFAHSTSSSGDTRGTCETTSGETLTSPTLTSASSGFHTIYEGPEIDIVNVGWGINQNGKTGTTSDAFRAFRINGEILIDSTTNNIEFGTNGFYLPFDGNTPIGEDQSGKGNNWTPKNFGGTVGLDQATGALPILNTLGGTITKPGVFGSESNTTVAVTVSNASGANKYYFDSVLNPTLGFIRGSTITFDTTDSSNNTHPFKLSSSNADSATGTEYTDGVAYYINGSTVTGSNYVSNYSNNGGGTGFRGIKWTVPHNVSTTYYYCTSHAGMGNNGRLTSTTDDTKADQFAWKNVLALPLVTGDDVSNQINCTSTKNTITNTNVEFVNTYGNFYGGSADFTGASTDLLNTQTDDTKYQMGTDSFTCECWIYSTSNSGTQNVFQVYAGGSKYYGIYYSSTLRFYIAGTGGAEFNAGDVVMGKNKWHHVALVRDGGTLRGFVDGVQIGSSSVSINIDETGYVCHVGRHSPSNNGFTGYMQDFRVYRGVAKYTDTFIPASTDPDILPDTPSGVAVKSKLTKITEGSVAFDGSGDWLDAPTSNSDFGLSSSDDFTIECFVYTSAGSELIRQGTSNAGSDGMYFSPISSGALETRISGTTKTTSGKIAFNGWNHISVSRSSDVLYMSINGVVESFGSVANSSTTGAFKIGANFEENSFFKGHISNLRFIKGTGLYTSNFNIPTEPLTTTSQGATASEVKLLCCQSSTQPASAVKSPNVSGVNSGVQWSAGAGPNFEAVNPARDGFNGAENSNTRTDNLNVNATVTFPVEIPFTTSLKVRGARDSGNGIIKLHGANGVIDVSSQFTSSSSSLETVTISGVTSPLKAITLLGKEGAAQPRFSAIYIDDVMLVDPLTPSGSLISTKSATTFNPFISNINSIRGQEGTHAVFNPINPNTHTAYYTLSNGNLKCTAVGGTSESSGARGYCASSIGMSSGKYYFECHMDYAQNDDHGIGIVAASATGIYSSGGENYIYRAGGGKVDNATTSNTYGDSFTSGDTIGISFDADSGELIGYKNGVSQGVIATVKTETNSASSIRPISSKVYYFMWGMDAGSAQNYTVTANFGQKPFKFPPPEGFQPLTSSTARPEIAVPDPSKVFSSITYKGNGNSVPDDSGGSAGGTQSIDVGFAPDLIWIKDLTTNGRNHNLVDTVRGAGSILLSDDSRIEVTNSSDAVTSFNSNGFTLGDNGAGTQSLELNCLNNDYIVWSWKAGGNKGTFNIDDVDMGNAAGASMSEGSLNTSAYDKSQTWSNSLVLAGNAEGSTISTAATSAFNGDLTNHFEVSVATGGQAVVLFNVTLTDVETLEFYGGPSAGGTNTITVTGTGIADSYIINVGKFRQPITVTNSTVSNLTFTCSGANNFRMVGLYVNGKLLVDTGVTPSNKPSITASGCSVGTKQGFSIVKYPGNQTAKATVAHGLTQAPDFTIVKQINGTGESWRVRHSAANYEQTLYLNQTIGNKSNTEYIYYTDAQTITLSTGLNGINGNNNYIMYNWHNVPGLQDFGTYIGNADSNGPFVETGMKPSLVVIKKISADGDPWIVYDVARSPENLANKRVQWNNSSDQSTSDDYAIDILSNGFKIRTSDTSWNGSGATFAYMAWAQEPAFNLFGSTSTAR